MPQNKNSSKVEPVSITVVYNNNPFQNGLPNEWGFSCLVEAGKTRLLFDTGNDGDILLSNLAKLGIDPESIDLVFLSNFRHEHTGGLSDFLKKNPIITIYYPWSFPEHLIGKLKNAGANLVPVSSFQEIKTNIFSLGKIDGAVPEQSLAVRSTEGIVVITGCTHHSIISTLQKAKNEFSSEPIYLVMGEFYLSNLNDDEINEVIQKLCDMEIPIVAPTDCGGSIECKLLEEVFDEDFIEMGVGQLIKIV